MRASEIIDEYDTFTPIQVAPILARGDEYNQEGMLTPVNVPLQGFDVKYKKRNGNRHSYYMFDKMSKKCVGLFSIDEGYLRYIEYYLQPGIRTVTPHMTLSKHLQKTGIATLCYQTFLQGGPWVFVTQSHTQGARALWNKLSDGNIISRYFYRDPPDTFGMVDDESQIPYNLAYNALRVMGPKDRFKIKSS